MIRKATKEDAAFIIKMIKDLAEYEKAPEQMILLEEQLIKNGFEENPLFEAIILEHNNEACGMALFYNRYSTWKGKSLYLEDLYVRPEARGNGLGMKAMKYLANYAVQTECKRFEWQVLDWNEPAINFYKSFNTNIDGEWMNCKLEGDEIKIFAEK